MDELQAIIKDVIELSDFQDTLNGLEEDDIDTAMFSYIQKTRQAVAGKPELIKTQQHSGQLIEMYDYLIKNWHTKNKFKAIEMFVEKRRRTLRKRFYKL